MKPVDQTNFGFPGGNCFSACVASLLEISLDEVPYFMGDSLEDDGGAWFEKFSGWLRPRNLWPICFKTSRDGWTPAGLHILSGKSPRELANPKALHSVVARGGEIEHDPHPSRAGLVSRDDFVILVTIDPCRDRNVLFEELARQADAIGAQLRASLRNFSDTLALAIDSSPSVARGMLRDLRDHLRRISEGAN